MRKLIVPPALKEEFSTVEALWQCNGSTRRVDALVVSWVKYEKQLRRLFSFFVFQHPAITEKTLDAVIEAFVANRNLNPETFISGIKALGVTPIPKLLGSSHAPLWKEIKRIKIYRNKIMHGQQTGQGIQSAQLEKDVIHIINWMSALAEASNSAYGYDGLRRGAYRIAKASADVPVQRYPFSNPAELKSWLSRLKADANG
ncbi:hypothetical protein I5V28_13890 [Stenotrophomonas maltophilia]|uniref:hypothetical protein n=1 Tax=Stenotrophomonas TaxID=40323 RepID=UPI001312B0FE|nr:MULTISPECIES: hypothetical protein [Stenotrophomonas]EKT4072007.1 hypothetical protein [Stenotrophomonas maltophilia]EKT4080533.1 hypothetical protein [Stenotrophomonas maltophilia]MBH1746907.1 hypothetical protein [Stenotrophomonas maltophilia]WNF10303.1 hypothetical protein RKE57_19935 [Stenotrophomonas geniculata]